METKARYLAVGLFTLLVILSGFGFVFWMERGGGLVPRETVLVRFENTVAGLAPGAAVLFDGLRVGEVSALSLDAADPRHVLVELAVAAGTPLRRDTHVGIDFQGLMGTATVSLEGGSASAPRLAAANGIPPTLVGDPEAGRGLSDTARRALNRVDALLEENAVPLKETIANLKDFSGALARNADKIDALLSGLQKMTGTGPAAPPIPVYDLAAPALSPAHDFGGTQVTIDEPTAVVALQTQRLLSRTDEGQLTPIGTMQWSDSLPKLLQAKLIESFDSAGLTATDTAPTAGSGERRLHLDLRRFDITADPSPKAEVNFGAKLLSADGHVLQARIFSVQVPATTDERSAVQALNTAFAEAARDLATWLDGRS